MQVSATSSHASQQSQVAAQTSRAEDPGDHGKEAAAAAKKVQETGAGVTWSQLA